MIQIRHECAWAKRPMWQKRLQGFASYLMAAFAALAFPIEADKAMFDTLKDQFVEK